MTKEHAYAYEAGYQDGMAAFDATVQAAYEQWCEKLAELGNSGFPARPEDILALAERVDREYDECVVAYPKNVTSEMLSANHAAGLPVTREHIVRCKDCDYFKANSDATHGGGFCRVWARPRKTNDGFCDHGLRRPNDGTSWDDILQEDRDAS